MSERRGAFPHGRLRHTLKLCYRAPGEQISKIRARKRVFLRRIARKRPFSGSDASHGASRVDATDPLDAARPLAATACLCHFRDWHIIVRIGGCWRFLRSLSFVHGDIPMRTSLLPCFLLLVLFAPIRANAEALPSIAPDRVGLAPEELSEIDALLQSYVSDEKLAGIVMLVAREGKVAHAGVFGKLDIEANQAMRRDALFRIYSMTKPITGVALMTLYDEGKFQLDDPVSKYLKGFDTVKVFAGKEGETIKLADLQRPVTIRDLMCHTAGLAYGLMPASPVDAMYQETRLLDRTKNLDSMLERLLKLPLAAQPGEKWMYSIAVDVQGKLIEVLSGKSLDAFFAERIFKPLAMPDTAFYVPADKLDRLAVNYGMKNGQLSPIDGGKTSQFASIPTLLSGGGGLISTADDYLRFAQMMLNRGELDGVRILKPETVDLMTQNQLADALVPITLGPITMPNTGFGLDFSVRVKAGEGDPAGSIGEYGWGGAASTQFFVSPREKMICVGMTQFMPATMLYVQEARKKLYAAIPEEAAAK
jgi:CubicO group peptidase (beta-lactamase class C family)